MQQHQKIKTLSSFILFVCLLTWLLRNNPFFWDTVQLASKHAHWYFDNDFRFFLLPEAIDSGHPPLFGMYLAAIWKIFGKSLSVSHFALLPFLIGIVKRLWDLGVYLGNQKMAKYLILLILLDPFFAGQSVLVSPDIMLVFAFLSAIYCIYQHKGGQLIIYTILLALISMRGMMLCLSLYLWWVLLAYFKLEQKTSKNIWQKLLYFIPSGIIASIFLAYHFIETGWIGYHPDSPWAGSFERVNFIGFLKNIGILAWRFLDFGRVFLLMSLAYLIYYFYKKSILQFNKEKIGSLALLSFILLFVLSPSLLLHKGLLSHRYLLPITLTLSLLFYAIWVQFVHYKAFKLQTISYLIAFSGLFTGNFWIYPRSIAQGWDATLAHIPYYDLRQKMIAYIDEQQIPYEAIGTVFPNIGPHETYDLLGKKEGFVRKDWAQNQYIFYSNVYNDFSDEELLDLEANWKVMQTYEFGGIEVLLYQK
jgi:hypothetical protein